MYKSMHTYLVVLPIVFYEYIEYNIDIIKQGTANGENDVAARRTGNTNTTTGSG